MSIKIGSMQAALSTFKSEELSLTTKMRLEALGIEPSTVSSESQARILISQAEAAPGGNNSGHQRGNNSKRHVVYADIQDSIFNEMTMISVSNRLILGL